ncbi:MAG: NAD(P)-binding protein, partial [Kribbellaceae bacterium]|nr:NAD(P)-binding protein [Kribbellaceae bacterium]
MRLSEQQRIELERFAESVVPGEGWQRSAVAFVERVLTEDRPDWTGRVERALAGEDREWLTPLVAQGYYAQPSAWRSVGWHTAEFATVQTELRVTPWAELADRYDCVVIGSGAGGGAAAQVLAESGRSVLVVELGSYPSTDALARDHLRNPRATLGLPAPTDPDPAGRPRVAIQDGVRSQVLPPDGGWGNNAFTVG